MSTTIDTETEAMRCPDCQQIFRLSSDLREWLQGGCSVCRVPQTANRKALTEQWYTVDGHKCQVAGYANDKATVGFPDGTYYVASWETIAEAARNGNVIDGTRLETVPQDPMVSGVVEVRAKREEAQR